MHRKCPKGKGGKDAAHVQAAQWVGGGSWISSCPGVGSAVFFLFVPGCPSGPAGGGRQADSSTRPRRLLLPCRWYPHAVMHAATDYPHADMHTRSSFNF